MKNSRFILTTLIIFMIAFGLTGIGFFVSLHIENGMGTAFRRSLHRQALDLSGEIDPRDVRTLSFSEEDLYNPFYQTLSDRLSVYSRFVGYEGVRTIGMRDGEFLFGPSSYSKTSFGLLEPGGVCTDPPEALRRVFTQRRPFTYGPYKGLFGEVLTAFVPLIDPANDEVVLTVAVDISKDVWEEMMGKKKNIPLFLSGAAVLMILFLGKGLLQRGLSGRELVPLCRQIETVIVLVLGIALTGFFSIYALMSDHEEQQIVFERYTAVRAEKIKHTIMDLDLHKKEPEWLFSPTGDRSVKWFAVLKTALGEWSKGRYPIATGLFLLSEEGIGAPLAVFPPDHIPRFERVRADKALEAYLFFNVQPIFTAEDVMIVFSHPTEEFFKIYPARLVVLTGIIGLILSFLSALFVFFLRSRQLVLESLVEVRTAELRSRERDLETALGEARRLKIKAEAADRAKSEFLANMSHEIRTPMNAVVGFTDLLLTSKLSEIQRQYLENVHSSADALLVLINDILDFSKIEAGRLELDLTTIDLRDQLEKTMDIVTFKAHEKDLELILDIDPNLPEFVVADSVRINQIVTNLLSNAVKFTESGEVELKAKKCEGAAPGSVTISVRDTGIGMTPKQRNKIFESFTQADHSTTRKYGGTGLGLSISKSLVEKMGGELDLESVPGKGSTFSFTLSFEVDKMKTHTSQAALKIKKVLVVDDNFNNRTILEAMFSHWGIETELVTNGIEALGILKGDVHFDAVILDYHMPFMNGLDVAEKIRGELQLPPEKEPIILLYSSADDPRVFERCRELNIEYKLVKPIKMKQLHDLLLQVQMGSQERKNLPGMTPGSEQEHGIEATPSPSPEGGMSGEKPSILVAEDNPPNMLLAKGLLGKMLPDATVLEAQNGREAIEKFREATPDLILMDVQMPELDGYGATAEIRALEAEAGVHTPIIALTAGALEGDREKCLTAGMDDYLTKPIMIGDLRERITKWLLTASQDRESSKGIVGEASPDLVETAKKFLSAQGHDAHTIDEMLKMVRARGPELLTELGDSLASGAAENLRRAAHSLKGIMSTLGLEKAAFLAMETEKASTSWGGEKALPHADALVRECEEFLKLLSEEET